MSFSVPSSLSDASYDSALPISLGCLSLSPLMTLVRLVKSVRALTVLSILLMKTAVRFKSCLGTTNALLSFACVNETSKPGMAAGGSVLEMAV